MKNFRRSVLTSLFTTGLDLGTLALLVEVFHVDYRIAVFLGTVVGSLSNFTINRIWAFEATHGMTHWQFVRFLPVQGGSSGLQTLGVWLMVDVAHLPYFRSKLVVAVLVYLCWNYPMNRYFVFPAKKEPSRAEPAGTSTPAA